MILSHDGFNQAPNWRSVIVVPISTSASQRGRGPTAIPLPNGFGGLSRDSIAVCHQITTLDRAKLTRKLGDLPSRALEWVELGVKAALDML